MYYVGFMIDTRGTFVWFYSSFYLLAILHDTMR